MGGKNYDINLPHLAIMVISTIICNVMSMSEEAECGALLS